MMIDAHTYLGSWPYWKIEDRTAEELEACLKANGIEKALVSSLRSIFYDAEEGNRELLAANKKFPDSLYGLATLSPFFKKEETGYQELKTGTFKGIKLYPRNHGFSLTRAGKIFEAAEELKVPVVIPFRLILAWNLPALTIDEILPVLRQWPKVTFVLSCFNYELMASMLLREFPPNLYFETSGLQVVDGIEILNQTIGADRVMLGTALPVQIAQSGIQKVLKAQLIGDQLEAVKWRNAAKLFGIK
jgi:predicted TIM-barrel fold metal-dependent hydrolase